MIETEGKSIYLAHL